MCVEENDYDFELCARGRDSEPEEGSSSSPLSAIPLTRSSASSLPLASSAASALPPSISAPLSTMASSRHTLPISFASTRQSPGSAASTGPITSSAAPVQTVVQQTVALSATPLQVVATSAAPLQAVAPSAAPVQTYPKLSRLEEQNTLKEELSLVRQTKVICSLDLLLDVFKKCQHPGCMQETAMKHHLNGPTAVIKWACSAGHKGTFSSSKDQNGIYCNNLQAAASIMLSSNNFAKVEKMANFLGLAFISDSTLYRMQRLYFIHAIDEWWDWQRGLLVREFLGKEVMVCGDGQCDSPGDTAKNLCLNAAKVII